MYNEEKTPDLHLSFNPPIVKTNFFLDYWKLFQNQKSCLESPNTLPSLALIIIRLRRIRQIKNNSRMRLSTPSISKLLRKINSTIKRQGPIRKNINIQSLEISRCINESNISCLHEIIGDNYVFLVGRYFDVVRSDCGLDFVRVVETLDVREIGDVEGGDVVCCCEGEVGVFSVLG